MKCNIELKWVNSNVSIILKPVNWLKMQITRMFLQRVCTKKIEENEKEVHFDEK